MNRNEVGYDKLKEYRKYLRSVSKVSNMDNDELFKEYSCSFGEERIKVRNKIVENNLLLVIKYLICKYTYMHDINPVYDVDDIIQEANLLLINLVGKYNSSKGKFSTYLYNGLNNHVYYCNGVPNTPVLFSRAYAGRFKLIKKYIELGYDDEYISKKLCIPLVQMDILRPVLTSHLSYDELINKGEIKSVIKQQDEQWADEKINQVLDVSEDKMLMRKIQKAMMKLKPAKRKIIEESFGLNGNPEKSLLEINAELGYGGTYIYKKYSLALSELRNLLSQASNDSLEHNDKVAKKNILSKK